MPLGRPRCEARITVAPWSRSQVIVGSDARIRPMLPEDVVAAERLSSESFFEVDARLARRGDPDPEPRSAERSWPGR